MVIKDQNLTKDNRINKSIIGLVGGMGSYATVDFFNRMVDAFPAEKEWDRPHIIIDNFCTMPSRVKNIIEPDEYEIDVLVGCLSYSVKKMIDYGADYIIFTCNTSHYYIPAVMKRVPELKETLVDMVSLTIDYLVKSNVDDVAILGTEGTVYSKIYENKAKTMGINTEIPTDDDLVRVRNYIEYVKQKKTDVETLENFVAFIDSLESKHVILGCTELPVIYKICLDNGMSFEKEVVDPIQITIENVRSRYCSE